jgi:radical SAM superfamily enzyme YgiQ (UPF0313 family)
MKVLLIHPESPATFWTFRSAYRHSGCKTLLPPLGLITAASLLPRHWEMRLVDLGTRPVTDDDWDWAEMIMVSGMLIQREELLSVVREAKRRKKLVVAGGPYPTALPDEVLAADCDFLVKGEGENTIPLLLKALEEGKINGIIESDGKPDMLASPMPRFDLLTTDDYLALGIQTSRGCPFDCEFCDIINLYGRVPRYKDPDQVIAELDFLYRLGWRKAVFICDDNFIGSKAHARAILSKLIPWMKSHGEPFCFWTQVSVNLGQDLELIDLMTDANFSTVFVGVESPDEEILALNSKFQNIRNPLVESIGNITRNGLTVVGSFVIGFDGEKLGAGDRICSFVELSGIPMPMLNTLHVLPHTRLGERLENEGRMLKEVTGGQMEGGRLNYIPTRPELEILAEFASSWEYLYEPSRFLARAYRYFLTMRPTRHALGQENGPGAPLTKSKEKPNLRAYLSDTISFFRLSWRHGVQARYRLQYWRQLLGIWRNNPSRLVKYLSVCVLGENMISLGETVRTRVTQTQQTEASRLKDS